MTEPLDLTGAEAPRAVVQKADTVNIDQPRDTIPHVRVVVAVTFFVLVTFAAVTAGTLLWVDDNTIKGGLIGCWTTMAVSSVSFWVGASSGGKLSKK